jgi:predicted  nucleic acid-binding Zn-ribbon protein
MIDTGILVTVVPPFLTGVFAFLIARKKNTISEKVSRAKIDAEIQTQALTIVRGVMNDMRDEFRREISNLKVENERMRKKLDDTENDISELHTQLRASDELVANLKGEIASLRSTIKIYEDEIARLKKLR